MAKEKAEEKAEELVKKHTFDSNHYNTAMEMYEWTKKRAIKEACEWFEQYLFDIGYPDNWLRDSQYQKSGEERFKKTMEERI